MKPNVKFSASEGYHPFANNTGSFEVWWNNGSYVDEGEPGEEPGWYWWACFPGCLPDAEPEGPYNSSFAAYKAARDY